jgi:hypothetical protein
MYRVVASNLRHLFTAAALLALLFVAAEIWLQTIAAVSASRVVCPQASVDLQRVLVPSSTAHHELLRRKSSAASAGATNFSTNSLGLRGKEPGIPKPAGLYRVLVLGDETVLGPGLPERHTLAARLQGFLTDTTSRNVEVLNAGVPGYSPLLSLLQYRNELFRLQPDLILLHFDMTDVADDVVHRRYLKYSDGQQICINPLLRNQENDQSSVLNLLKKSAIWRAVTARILNAGHAANSSSTSTICRNYEWTTDSALDLRLQVRHAMDPVIRLADLARQHHTQLVIATSPVPWQVVSSDDFPELSQHIRLSGSWPVSKDVPQLVLNALCSNLSISFCDATTAFRSVKASSKLFRSDAPQLSEFGTALYAREIAATLLKSPDVAKTILRATTASAPTTDKS